MKKQLSLFLVLIMLTTICSYAIDDEVKVFINDKRLAFDQPPIIVDGRTLVSIRAVCEALGADVYWYEEEQDICIVKNQTKLFLQIDSNVMTIVSCANFEEFTNILQGVSLSDLNKIKEVFLDVSPMIYNDRTLLPIRGVCEAFGAIVDYNEASKSILISCSQEWIEDKNRDIDFYEKLIDFIKDAKINNTTVYNHRGEVEIFVKDKEFLSNINYYYYLFLDNNNINLINAKYKEKSVLLDIEYTDNIAMETIISDYLNNNTNVTVRNAKKDIVYGMDDIEEMGFYSYEMEFSVFLKDKNAQIDEDLFLYIDDEYIGKCSVAKNDSGIFLNALWENDIEKMSVLEYIVFVSPYAKRVNSKNTVRKIEKIEFTETECKQYEKNIIFAAFGQEEFELCRSLAQEMNRNFGVTHGLAKQDFEQGYADVLISGNTEAYYLNHSDYYTIGVKNDTRKFYITVRARDNEIYEEIKTALKSMTNYEVFSNR